MFKKMILAAATAASLVAVATPAHAQDGRDRRVNVINASGQAVREIYASPVTSRSWEEDMLGANVLPAGRSMVFNIDNGTSQCRYDLKAVMSNGREHIRRNVNVCVVGSWTITNRGNSLR
jgi:hypothetical protein